MSDLILNGVDDVDLSAINDEIIELKKKIQLSEGMRKTYFEECDAEKRQNAEIIRQLKKEIKECYAEVKKPSPVDECILNTSKKKAKHLSEFLRKPPEVVEERLDLKIIDLKKKLDLINYRIKQKENKLKATIKKLKEITEENHPDTIQRQIGPKKKKITKLETKIYRVKLNIHEMRHVQKKYLAIRQSLLDDSVHFNSTLDKLEDQLTKQNAEIQHLKDVKFEATHKQDRTRGSLSKLEGAVVAATSERSLHIQQLRRMVEERKTQLERVERSLLPSAEHEDYRETVKKTIAPFYCPEKDRMDLIFEKLKTVTGAKNPEEVLSKFKAQRDTKLRLTELKHTTERDKKELEMRKLSMEAELESYKFAQVKEKERSEEEIEQLENDILQQLNEEKVIKEETDSLKQKLLDIKKIFFELCMQLKEIDDVEIPDTNLSDVNMDDLIDVISKKVASLFQMKDLKESELREERLDPSGILDSLLEVKKVKKVQREGPSDVPTRAYLKRQSQLYVEAVTRRKGFQQKAQSAEKK